MVVVVVVMVVVVVVVWGRGGGGDSSSCGDSSGNGSGGYLVDHGEVATGELVQDPLQRPPCLVLVKVKQCSATQYQDHPPDDEKKQSRHVLEGR